jgi:hypothetical protein
MFCAFTIDPYSHLVPGMVDWAADRLERVISEGRQDVQRGA